MAKLLRKNVSTNDTTVTPSGTGRLIFQQEGGYIVVYAPAGPSGADTFYTEQYREPCATGFTYTASVHNA